MSAFEVKVRQIDGIEPIPGADMIELARVADYRSVVQKGAFKPGDFAVYIPEASILPDSLIEEMGLTGKLAGSSKNRVKAVKLRGCLSQGILYRGDLETLAKEENVATALGIVKYEPPIPQSMAGEVCAVGPENTIRYDIENLKAYPDAFTEREQVSVTEKLHGTFCGIGYIPGLNHSEVFEGGDVIVFSKGLGAKGLVFKDNEANAGNVYVRMFRELTKEVPWKERLGFP